ncbi:MAG: hypothetical protein BME93_03010 [Methanosarcinales archaeon Met12]|nr:MAG: hypothetical protein BME93_03010 [Methanosarcinales archaeon Met12]
MVSIKSGRNVLLISIVILFITLLVIAWIVTYGIFIYSALEAERPGLAIEWHVATLLPWIIIYSSLLIYCSLRGLVPSRGVVHVGTFIVLPCFAAGIVSSWVHTLLLLSIAISALCLIQIYTGLTSILSKKAKLGFNIDSCRRVLKGALPASHTTHLGMAIIAIGVILDTNGIVHADGIMWAGCLVLTVGCTAAFYAPSKEPIEVEYIRKKDVKKRYEERLQEELKKLRERGT